MGIYKYPRTYSCGTQTFSYSKSGNIRLTEHFTLKEFRSKDGADEIVICPDLLNLCLEPLFKEMNAKAINITSGYRSIAHSKAIGGSGAKDNHHMGMAADIKVKKQDGTYFSAKEVAVALQHMGWEHGIGLMNTAVHVDTGSKYWFDETKKSHGSYVQVADWYSYTGISKPANANPAPTPKPAPAPAGRVYAHKIGEHVVFSTCYKSSNASFSEAIGADKMSRNHGVITKIVDAQNPYLLDNGLCWVNDGDIRGLYSATQTAPAPKPQSKPTHRGTAYILTCDKLSVRKSATKMSRKVGEYYRGQTFYVIRWQGNWAQLESGNWMCAGKYSRKA